MDLIDEAEVSEQEAENLAETFKIPLIRVCSKDNIMVKEVFCYLAKKYFGENRHLMDDIGYKSPIASIDQIKKQSLDNSGMGSLKQKKQTIKLE